MKFSIRFSRSESYEDLFNIDRERIGLELLDRARVEIGVNFDAILLKDFIPEFERSNILIPLSELAARTSERFADVSEQIVKIDFGDNPYATRVAFEQRYTVKNLHHERNPDSGAVTKVWYEREILHQRLLEDWKEAGFPLEWEWVDPS